MFKKYKKIIFIAVLISLIEIIFSYAENKNIKTYEIINPISGVIRIVDENGNTLVKTESGLNEIDTYQGGRQETIDSSFVINYKSENLNQKQNQDKNENNFIILYDFENKADKSGNIKLDDVKTNNFYVEKVKDKYVFVCKKYDYKINKLLGFKIWKNTVDQRAYIINCDKGNYFIDDDGKVIMFTKDRYISDNKILFVNKEYVLKHDVLIKRSNKTSDILSSKWERNVPDASIFGEIVKEDIMFGDNLDACKILDKYYFIFSDEHYDEPTEYIIVDEKGEIVKNATVVDDFILFPVENGKNLYNREGKLIKEKLDFHYTTIGKLEFIKNIYDEFKNYYYLRDYKKIMIIDKDGKTIIDNLAKIYQKNIDNNEEKLFLANNKNVEICLFNKDVKIIYKSKNEFDIWSNGNYFLIFDNDKFLLLNKNGKNVLNDKYILNIKRNGKYYTPSKISDYENYYIKHETYNNFDIWAYGTNQWSDPQVDAPRFQFNDINGDLLIYNDGKYDLYDENGKILLEDYKLLARYNDNFILFIKGFEYGLIDRNGKIKFKFSIFDGMTDDE